MPIDCFFFLHVNRPCVQIRFGDTEGLFYFPEVVICVVYLQGFHIQFRCHQEIISCVFQILINLCLIDFNYRLFVFSMFIYTDTFQIHAFIISPFVQGEAVLHLSENGEKAIQMNIYLNGFSFTLHYADSNSSFLIISSIRFSSIPATSAIWAVV